jgi:hypothetical protein
LLPVIDAITGIPKFGVYMGRLLQLIETGPDMLMGVLKEYKIHAKKYLKGREPNPRQIAPVSDATLVKYEDLLGTARKILDNLAREAGSEYGVIRNICRTARKTIDVIEEQNPKPIKERPPRGKRAKRPKNGNGNGGNGHNGNNGNGGLGKGPK